MERFKIVSDKILKMNGIFSIRKVCAEAGIDPKNARIVLDRMAREGLLQRYQMIPIPYEGRGRPGFQYCYQVANKNNLKDRIAPKMKEGTALDRMWQVIRYMRKFKRRDLIQIAEVNHENAKWFTKMLHRAGFLQPSKAGGPGVEWTLIKDPGPKRPYIGNQKKRIGHRA